jgi:antitoxin (DNA-binding transcriptional repressor) of toxin-antitoxin stability system
MPKRSSIRETHPRDANQLAKLVVEIATGERVPITEDGKNAAAVALGRRGGLKGGKARAAALSAEERSKIAKKAAAARWKSKRAK